MKQQVISQLLEVKQRIERAQVLQLDIDHLYNESLPKKEKEIKDIQRKIQSIEEALVNIQNKIDNGYRPIGCTAMLFIFLGVVIGLIIGTEVLPVVGTIIGALIGGFLCNIITKIMRKFVDSILMLILTEKAKNKRKQKIKEEILEERESLIKQKEKKEIEKEQLIQEQAKVTNEKNELITKMNNLNTILSTIEKPTFLSVDYCEIPIIEELINFLESGRADTLKEALNLFEDQLHKDAMLELQRQQVELTHKTTEQQQEILRQQIKQSKQLRYGNTLHTINTVRHWSKKR